MASKLFYRIIYGFSYTFLYIILLALLLAVPGDIFRQAVPVHKTYHIIIISAAYVLTAIIVGFIYLSRLYVNRSVLASIPKSWIPIDKSDVSKNVYKMIVTSLSRSATIALESRPRVPGMGPRHVPTGIVGQTAEKGPEVQEQPHEQGGKASKGLEQGLGPRERAEIAREELGINLPPHQPVWGEIEHNGWASPTSPDLTNVQYISVVSELPNLIEAKALTLAPPDVDCPTNPPMLDADAVALLQRPAAMSLRDYLNYLGEIGVLEASQTTRDFLSLYELARFSARATSNSHFRELMHLFAEILRSMKPLDPAVLEGLVDEEDPIDGSEMGDEYLPSESDIDNDAPLATNPTTPRSQRSLGSLRSQQSRLSFRSGRSVMEPMARTVSSSSTGSQIRRPRPPVQPARTSSANTRQHYRTAPTTPKSRRTAVSPSPSASSFAQTRQPYPVSQPSSASLRSAASSAGSVIRLSDRRDDTDLPYVLQFPSGGALDAL